MQHDPSRSTDRASTVTARAATSRPSASPSASQAKQAIQRDSSPSVADRAPTVATRSAAPLSSGSLSASQAGRAIQEGTARTFVWAPVEGAIGYEMQLLRGSRRVFVSRTRQPRLTLFEPWHYAGRATRLEPGRYRWTVSALRAGGIRGGTPAVQAKLVIAPG